MRSLQNGFVAGQVTSLSERAGLLSSVDMAASIKTFVLIDGLSGRMLSSSPPEDPNEVHSESSWSSQASGIAAQ